MNINTVASVTEVAFSGTDPLKTQTVDTIKTVSEPVKNQKDEKKLKSVAPLEDMQKMVDTLNEYMDDLTTDIGFFINKKLNNQVIIEIKNRKTDELIKQIPSEELVRISEKMAELTGLLLDKSI